MSDENLSVRKKEHLDICSDNRAMFKQKTNGFENYDFIHCADTEVIIDEIDLSTQFFNKKISFPFFISCMTGGTDKADNINLELAFAAQQTGIPLGLGSIRYAIEDGGSFENIVEIKKVASTIPVLGNIGAAQILSKKNQKKLVEILSETGLDAMVIHLNPLQELLQKEGEPSFGELLKSIERFIKKINVPLVVKEVGSGISKQTAERLLDAGVKGIDVAGAGGTSWAAVELIRTKKDYSEFWDWGLPTSYCIRTVAELKKKYKFTLIGSGGINTPFDSAKAMALGSDLTASARKILHQLNQNGVEGVIDFINDWFNDIKKIMFLTGSKSLKDFNKQKIILKKELH